MIYLDYSATTPVEKSVLDTFVKVSTDYIGNPNSLHKLGFEAKELIEASTMQIANILGIKPSEIIYTSGATEANNMALKGICYKYRNRGRKIITTHLEHSSILKEIPFLEENGFTFEYVNLDENGLVDLEDLKLRIDDEVILVSISAVNSETGLRQPVEKIGEILKDYPKVLFHSDITQIIGKDNIDLTYIDLASFSAQKFYGIKGIGALIKKENVSLEPLIHGGASTTIYRSGTPATALIVSMAKALRLATDSLDEKKKYVAELSNYLKDQLRNLDVGLNSNEYCLPHIVNFSLKDIKSETMLHALEAKDIYISTKTACSKGEYSDAILALYNDKKRASTSLRISISHLTTKEELAEFVKALSFYLNSLKIS